jgi:hypothetical protein
LPGSADRGDVIHDVLQKHTAFLRNACPRAIDGLEMPLKLALCAVTAPGIRGGRRPPRIRVGPAQAIDLGR